MNRNRWIMAGIAAVVLVIVIVVLVWPSGHHPVKGDNDHASDCWAHVDRLGHRHCAST